MAWRKAFHTYIPKTPLSCSSLSWSVVIHIGCHVWKGNYVWERSKLARLQMTMEKSEKTPVLPRFDGGWWCWFGEQEIAFEPELKKLLKTCWLSGQIIVIKVLLVECHGHVQAFSLFVASGKRRKKLLWRGESRLPTS